MYARANHQGHEPGVMTRLMSGELRQRSPPMYKPENRVNASDRRRSKPASVDLSQTIYVIVHRFESCLSLDKMSYLWQVFWNFAASQIYFGELFHAYAHSINGERRLSRSWHLCKTICQRPQHCSNHVLLDGLVSGYVIAVCTTSSCTDFFEHAFLKWRNVQLPQESFGSPEWFAGQQPGSPTIDTIECSRVTFLPSI